MSLHSTNADIYYINITIKKEEIMGNKEMRGIKMETYEVSVKCCNCSYQTYHTDKIEIEVGTKVCQKECPECKTKSLIKKEY